MARGIIRRALWICLVSILLGFPGNASAQGDGMIIIILFLQQLNKVADLSLSYSMARTTNPPGERVIPLGAQFGSTVHVRKNIGIDADLAGQSGKPAGSRDQFNMFEYLFGPRFSAHTKRATFFGRVLAGGVHFWQDSGQDAPSAYEGNGFAAAFGGGIDVNVSERIAIRAIQLDWIPFRENGSWKTNTARFGCGIVIRSANRR